MAARSILVATVSLCAILLPVLTIYVEDYYLPVSFLLVLLTMLPFFIRFECRRLEAREIVLIAILAAIAAVSRIPFAPIPSVQPTTFVIIVSALVFGAETGFMIGSVAALVSNLFLGQGPWTPWQMFSWGIIGFAAGWMKDTWWMRSRWGKLIFGFAGGFFFGWLMNLSFVFSFLQEFSWKAFAAIYAASFWFDFAHALSNVFFLTFFGARWIKILERFKRKYGLL